MNFFPLKIFKEFDLDKKKSRKKIFFTKNFQGNKRDCPNHCQAKSALKKFRLSGNGYFS